MLILVWTIIQPSSHGIAFDRWGAVQMVQNLESMGFTVVPFGQGFKDMSPPTKELMKLVLEQKIAHGGHLVLRWNMDNIYIRTDPAGNIKADKEKSIEKIDGAVATIMALDRAIRCGNDHEAIIPKEIFMRVQDELVRRRLVKVSPNGRKHGFSINHVFSQMIVCGECGELFRRVHWNNHGCRSIVWRCVSRLQPAGVICHARTVNEEVLKNVVVQAFNEMLGSRSTYQKRLRDNLATVLRGYEDEQALEIDKRLAELQQELINHASRKEDYNDIADEIFRLREMKQKNFTDTAVRDEQVKRINELNEFIEQQDSELTEFDESLARRWIKEIVVWDDHCTVELKSRIKVDVER